MLSLLNFLWYGALSANLADHLVEDEQVSPGDASAEFSLASDGVAYSDTNAEGTVAFSGEWLTAGSNSDFESRATLVTGTLSSGTTGTWQVLSTTRTWGVVKTTTGSKQCAFTLEIRRVSDSAVVATASILLTARKTVP